MAGKLGPLLAEDGEVAEILLLVVVVAPDNGGLLDGIKLELRLGPGRKYLSSERLEWQGDGFTSQWSSYRHP